MKAITQAYSMTNSKQFEISVMRRNLLRANSIQNGAKNVVSPQINTPGSKRSSYSLNKFTVSLPEISVDSTGTNSIQDDPKATENFIETEDSHMVDPREVGGRRTRGDSEHRSGTTSTSWPISCRDTTRN